MLDDSPFYIGKIGLLIMIQGWVEGHQHTFYTEAGNDIDIDIGAVQFFFNASDKVIADYIIEEIVLMFFK